MRFSIQAKPAATALTAAIIAFAPLQAVHAAEASRFWAIGGIPESQLLRIEVEWYDQVKVTVRNIGPIGHRSCLPLTFSLDGRMLTVCATEETGVQRLVLVDPQTGSGSMFGEPITGLNVMGMELAPDGKLYAFGDSNAQSPTYNSLFTINPDTGRTTRIGSTEVQGFFMDLAFDADGRMWATNVNALFRVDPSTGKATKVIDYLGASNIMGLSFAADGWTLFASDFRAAPNGSGLYYLDYENGFLFPLARLGPNLHSLLIDKR
ncbi:MAG: hypothetical protein LC130_35455 [Bryobacterales bacterium]|nr:hypothetical protein [Bryobacterales bacterium]